MKTLILNSFKIKRKHLIFYLAFIIIIFSIKTFFMNSDRNNFISNDAISFALMTIVMIQFAFFIISDQSLIVDDTKAYLLTLTISRKDLVNNKFLEVLLAFMINTILTIYLMHDVSLGNISIELGLFFILSFMSYYLLLIPVSIQFKRDSMVSSLILFGPAFLPLLDKVGVDPVKYITKFYGSVNVIIPFALILIFVMLIYIISIKLIERKDF